METLTQTLSLPIMVLLLAGLVGLVWWANAEPPAQVVEAMPRKRKKKRAPIDVPADEDTVVDGGATDDVGLPEPPSPDA